MDISFNNNKSEDRFIYLIIPKICRINNTNFNNDSNFIFITFNIDEYEDQFDFLLLAIYKVNDYSITYKTIKSYISLVLDSIPCEDKDYKMSRSKLYIKFNYIYCFDQHDLFINILNEFLFSKISPNIIDVNRCSEDLIPDISNRYNREDDFDLSCIYILRHIYRHLEILE